MTRSTEPLFIDPAVADVATLPRGGAQGWRRSCSTPLGPAARRVAAALAGRRGLDSVNIVAHGVPGRISFTAGDWPAETLAEQAADFAAIGRVPGENGGLEESKSKGGLRR